MGWRIVQSLTYAFDGVAEGLDLETRLAPLKGARDVEAACVLTASLPWDERIDRRDHWGNVISELRFNRPLRRLALSASFLVEESRHALPDDVPPDAADLNHQAAPERLVEECRSATEGRKHAADRRDACFAALLAGFEVDAAVSRPDATLAEIHARRSGVCQDIAKLCVAGLRACDIPARFVVGYRCGRTAFNARAERHAWLAAHLDGAWVESDPTPGYDADALLVATAWGPDFLAINPVVGRIFGDPVATRLQGTTQIEAL